MYRYIKKGEKIKIIYEKNVKIEKQNSFYTLSLDIKVKKLCIKKKVENCFSY